MIRVVELAKKSRPYEATCAERNEIPPLQPTCYMRNGGNLRPYANLLTFLADLKTISNEPKKGENYKGGF